MGRAVNVDRGGLARQEVEDWRENYFFPPAIGSYEALRNEAKALANGIQSGFDADRETHSFEEAVPAYPGVVGRRFYHEGQVDAVFVVTAPRAGIEVSVRHWSVPPNKVLTIFVPVDPITHSIFSTFRSGSFSQNFPIMHVREKLETLSLNDLWIEAGPAGGLWVDMYSVNH